MTHSLLLQEITNLIPNDIYKEIIGHNPRSWFGVNKYLHGIAEKVYYSLPNVIHDITYGRSLLYIITSNSLRGLSLALRVYQGVSTLDTYAHSGITGEKFDIKYNLLSYIWFPTLTYQSHMNCYETDTKLTQLEVRVKNPDKVKMYKLFLEVFPQERMLVSDILGFIQEFIGKWSSWLDAKWIGIYMGLFLSCPTIKSVIADNIRSLLNLASNRKHVFEYLIKCEFVTSEDKSVAVSGNVHKSGVGGAIKDLSLDEAVRLLTNFKNGGKLSPSIIKAILQNHPFDNLATINKAVDLPESDVTMRNKFWSLCMDTELAALLETRFPIKNRLRSYTGTSLTTATYLLKLDLRDDINSVIDDIGAYLTIGDVIYKVLIQNEVTKAELIKNYHNYMLKLLSCKSPKCKVIIALTALKPQDQQDVSYLDIVYSKRTLNTLKTLLPYLGKRISKNVFITEKGKHRGLLRSYNVEIVPPLTTAEEMLFS